MNPLTKESKYWPGTFEPMPPYITSMLEEEPREGCIPFEIRTVIHGKAFWLRTTYTLQLLEHAQKDPTIAQFFVHDFLAALAAAMKQPGAPKPPATQPDEETK